MKSQTLVTDCGEIIEIGDMTPKGVAISGNDFNLQLSKEYIRLQIHTKEKGEHDVDISFNRVPKYT